MVNEFKKIIFDLCSDFKLRRCFLGESIVSLKKCCENDKVDYFSHGLMDKEELKSFKKLGKDLLEIDKKEYLKMEQIGDFFSLKE